MKKSKRDLLIFISVLFFILLINTFIYNFLSGLKMSLFLGLALVVFKFIFGFEKSKFRVTKEVVIDTCVFILIFMLLFYLFGLVINFAKTGNYYTFEGFKNFILPVVFTSIIREILRYNYLTKSGKDKLLIILSIITFILIDISNAFYNTMRIFKFFALNLLPAISFNLYATYVSRVAGYKSIIIYSLIMRLYMYLIPIIPDANEYFTSLINFLLPIIILYRAYLTVRNESDETVPRDYNKKDYISLAVSAFIVILLVYFSSGYFKYYAVAIATGSMSPTINRGDVVIIKKTKDYEKIENGKVIAYDYHNHLIVHRLVNKVNVDGKYYFYSKGDANKDEDNYAIEEEMIVGTVSIKIPYLGLPTIWLNELWED